VKKEQHRYNSKDIFFSKKVPGTFIFFVKFYIVLKIK